MLLLCFWPNKISRLSVNPTFFDYLKKLHLFLELAKQLCEDYGFIGLYPLDNIADFTQEPNMIAKQIFVANNSLLMKLIL